MFIRISELEFVHVDQVRRVRLESPAGHATVSLADRTQCQVSGATYAELRTHLGQPPLTDPAPSSAEPAAPSAESAEPPRPKRRSRKPNGGAESSESPETSEPASE
jgi:hypothetical protein